MVKAQIGYWRLALLHSRRRIFPPQIGADFLLKMSTRRQVRLRLAPTRMWAGCTQMKLHMYIIITVNQNQKAYRRQIKSLVAILYRYFISSITVCKINDLILFHKTVLCF